VTDWDVAVVGAGIAGLTAARVAAEHGLRVTAFDQLAPGGELINIAEIVGYPGLPEQTIGPDLAGELLERALAAGAQIGYAEVTRLVPGSPAQLDTADGPATAWAVVVATGLTPGRVAVPDAQRWAGRGLSACASCDGPLFAGQRVAVLGDDEWAGREALALADLAAHVTVLAPGAPRWSPVVAERLAAAPTVDVRTDTEVTNLTGDHALESVTISGGTELPVTGVFSYLGKAPRNALLDGVPLGAPGIFLAGDVRVGATQYLIAAAADGLAAGLAAVAHLRKE
jgi:thioredoxin reductase (NADPH)